MWFLRATVVVVVLVVVVAVAAAASAAVVVAVVVVVVAAGVAGVTTTTTTTTVMLCACRNVDRKLARLWRILTSVTKLANGNWFCRGIAGLIWIETKGHVR